MSAPKPDRGPTKNRNVGPVPQKASTFEVVVKEIGEVFKKHSVNPNTASIILHSMQNDILIQQSVNASIQTMARLGKAQHEGIKPKPTEAQPKAPESKPPEEPPKEHAAEQTSEPALAPEVEPEDNKDKGGEDNGGQ